MASMMQACGMGDFLQSNDVGTLSISAAIGFGRLAGEARWGTHHVAWWRRAYSYNLAEMDQFHRTNVIRVSDSAWPVGDWVWPD
jgi:hypothetical protein